MKKYPLLAIPLMLFGVGCVKPDDAPVVKAPPPKTTPGKAAAKAPPPQVKLPELAPPVPAPASRVVHLLFTSNVDGEIEPCG